MVVTLTVSTPAFFESLKKSNLLSARQVAHLRAMAMQSGTEVEPTVIAEALVKKGLITRWQATSLLAGKHAFFLGKYKLLDRIGSGGMGAVFKATHSTIGHIVALKVVSKQRLSQPGAIARFSREIQAAAALHHPNIITAFDADKVGDTHFLVMEYVDGRDLNGWLKQYSTLPVDWSCECIRQAALGLQHAHEKGMVHRDIKPGNLLVTQDPETGMPVTKILDMGLARFTSEAKGGDGDITQTGQILGTPDYIAPEQARDTKNADIRADIFSLGCTLFRILTGKLPFEGDNPVEKLVARYTQDAPKLRTLRPDAPAELEAVLTKMMARDLTQRYQLPHEVADALVPFAMGQGASMAEGDAPSLASMSRLDTQVLSDEPGAKESSATCEFLNLLANVRAPEADTPHAAGDTTGSLPSIGGVKPGKGKATRVARYPHRQPNILELIEEKFSDLPLAAKFVAGAAAIAVILVLGMIGRKAWERSGQTTLAVDWPAELRDESSGIVVDGQERSVPRTGDLEFKGSWGLRRVVLSRKGYEPYIFEETLGRGVTRTITPNWIPTAATAHQMRIEADARMRAEQFKTLKAEVIRVQGGTPSVVQAAAMRKKLEDFIKQWGASTDESKQAAGLLRGFPVPLDRLARAGLPPEYGPLADQTPLAAVFGVAADDRLRHSGLVTSMVHSDDGRFLAAASQDELKIWNANGTLHKSLPDPQRPTALAFSSNGKLLATLSYTVKGAAINVYDVERGVHLHALTGLPQISRLAFQPKSPGTLAAGSFDGTIWVWNAVAGGNPARSFKAHARAVTALAFSTDGKRLFTAGQANVVRGESSQPIQQTAEPLRIWDFEKGAELGALDDKVMMTPSLLVSPDDRLLIVDAPQRVVRAWDVTAKTFRSIPLGEAYPNSIDLSPDGKTLAVGFPTLQSIRLIDFASGAVVAEIAGARGWGQSFTFLSKDRMAFAGLTSFKVRMYDVAQKTEVIGEQGQGHQHPVTSLSFSPGGETLASVGLDQRLLLWDTATGQSRLPTPPLPGAYAALYSPIASDGSSVLAVCTVAPGQTSGQLHLLDAKTGAVKKSIAGMQYLAQQPTAWAFTPDGRYLAVAWSGQTLKIVEAATGAEVKTLARRTSPISSLAFNFDGSRLALAEFNQPQIHLLETKTWGPAPPSPGVPSTILANQATIRVMSFTPDNYLLVTAGEDGSLKFWDAKTYQEKGMQPELVRTLSMTRVDTTMATCDDAGLVKIWDYTRAAKVNSFQLPQYFQVVNNQTEPIRSVNQLTFSPDGRHLATANGNGTIYILRLSESAATRTPGVASR